MTARPCYAARVSFPEAVVRQVQEHFAERVPHNKALGLRLVEMDEGGVVSELPYRSDLVGDPEERVLGGGAIAAQIDATCGMAVPVRLRRAAAIATLDLRVDHVAPAAPEAGARCRAECYAVTPDVAFVRAEAHCAGTGELIATAAGSFIIFGDRGVGDRESRDGGAEAPPGGRDRAPAGAPAWARGDAGSVADSIRRSREGGDPQRLAEAIPYAAFLAIGMRAPARGALVGTLGASGHLLGNAARGDLHGGATAGLLEWVSIAEILWRGDLTRLPRTLGLTLHYLRSGKDRDTFARADIRRLGNRVANVHATAWQESEERPIAAAAGHFLLEA